MPSQKSKAASQRPAVNGDWIEILFLTIGQYIKVETTDGCHREGRLSGLGSKELSIQGKSEKILVDIELNGDPQDRLTIDRIATLEVL